MKKVTEVCRVLADSLEKKGIKIDKTSLINAAKLHDVLRTCDFLRVDPKSFQQRVTKKDLAVWGDLQKKYGKIGHEKAMYMILRKMSENKLANLVLKHDFWRIGELKTWEEKILYYADKRVEGTRVVTLRKRFEEGKKRNAKKGEDPKRRIDTENKVIMLEKEFKKILGKLPI
jgi:hypothetical protein